MNKDNKDIIGTDIDNWKNTDLNFSEFKKLNDEILSQISLIHQGGGPIAIQKQHNKKRMADTERQTCTPTYAAALAIQFIPFAAIEIYLASCI